jgi:hypothetical protein
MINVNNGSIYFNQVLISFPVSGSICGINSIIKPDETTMTDSSSTT